MISDMRALVTGGNGHIGYALVRELLAAGHTVRASVRVLDDWHTAPFEGLDVEVVGADVRDADSLRAATDGMDTLFHVAAVYSLTDPGREREIIATSVQGAENALRAAAATGVRKVVLTSSVAALPLTAKGAPAVTEAEWRTDLRVPYMRAKTEAEQLAWRLARELGLDLATVLPGGVIGPGFRRNTPTVDIVQAALGGMFRPGAPEGNFTFVDVRDVARAHLLAAEPGVTGRFAVIDVQPSFRELVGELHRIDPRVRRPLLTLPRLLVPALPMYDRLCHRLIGTPRIATPEVVATSVSGLWWNVSSERARAELGWAPTVPFEQSLRETVHVLQDRRAATAA
jgi:dihydroflavonol-4-reductase